MYRYSFIAFFYSLSNDSKLSSEFKTNVFVPGGVLLYKSDGGARHTFKGFKFVNCYRL